MSEKKELNAQELGEVSGGVKRDEEISKEPKKKVCLWCKQEKMMLPNQIFCEECSKKMSSGVKLVDGPTF